MAYPLRTLAPSIRLLRTQKGGHQANHPLGNRDVFERHLPQFVARFLDRHILPSRSNSAHARRGPHELRSLRI